VKRIVYLNDYRIRDSVALLAQVCIPVEAFGEEAKRADLSAMIDEVRGHSLTPARAGDLPDELE
jgi:hypothetical protein